MKLLLLGVLTLALQRLLGLPGVPPALAALVVPAVLPAGAALLRHGGMGFWAGIALGLGWDAVLGPVVGPGAIAWSAAALATGGMAVLLADRTPRAWALAGALVGLVVLVVRQLALWPLGLAEALDGWRMLWTVVLTAGWCGLVGLVVRADLPRRWGAARARRLR